MNILSPKNKMQYMKLEDVIPYVNNPRNNEDAVEKVASSIREFGFQQPIMVDKENTIICGHTRYHAAKRLKLDTVPVVVSENLTPAQVKAYRLADNKTAEFSSWDFTLLNSELDQLLEMEIDMSIFEFYPADDDYIDSMFDNSVQNEKNTVVEKREHQINSEESHSEPLDTKSSEEHTCSSDEPIECNTVDSEYKLTVTFRSKEKMESFIEYCDSEKINYVRCAA